jgi:selenide,water dikinase
VLRPLQDIFTPKDWPDLLVGLNEPDDAAVWRLDQDRCLLATTDFFTPVVDDAYTYGAIAAANALSDLYAMGASPILTLNIAAFPADLPLDLVQEVFRGGAEKVKEAGAVVAGGHTIQDREPKFGLVAIGLCEQDALMTKTMARPGDVLVLTKPIGTGTITTALRQEQADPEHVQEAIDWMMRLNAPASQAARAFKVRAATDVTGFGLLGHGTELAEASDVSLRIHFPSVPFLTGARGYIERNFFPAGSVSNYSYFGPKVVFDDAIDKIDRMLLFDAQTSGGLLMAVPAIEMQALMSHAERQELAVWAIGAVEEGKGIRVVDNPYSFEAPKAA